MQLPAVRTDMEHPHRWQMNLSVGQRKVGTLFFASMLLLNACTPVLAVIPVGVEKAMRVSRRHELPLPGTQKTDMVVFVSAALRCRVAGFNRIEFHAAHGMYLDEVIETSERMDEYGGSFENCVRLLTELIAEIRERCGKDVIVAVRFGNPSYEELLKTADAVQAADGDLLDVSSGMGRYLDVPSGFPYDGKVYAASLVKARASLPVICVGNIFTGDEGEAILKEGLADMIAVGRGSLADPAWARKTLAGESPNPCLRCKNCMWYMDGALCPARRKENKEQRL